MKIVVIQDFLRSGGTERQAVLLANAFAAAGHTTTLLTFRPGGVLDSTVAPVVTRRSLQPVDFGVDWFAPGLTRNVRAASPDVILCMGRMANSYAGRLQARFPQVPVVATMRTGKPLPGPFVRSLHGVRVVVANSHEVAATLVDRYAVPREKISVIHNALVFPSETSIGDRSAIRAQLRAAQGAAAQTTVLLCVAMFRPEKNQRELVETVATLPADLDWQLWLAGDGPARAECEALATQRGIARRVKFLGFHRDPTPLYAAADIAVHASRSDALSNFVIEAQAQGVPGVVYQAQGMDECFVPDQTGWSIPRDDVAAFHAAILRVARDTDTGRAARTEAARQYARQTFDPQRQIAAYLELFQRHIRAPKS
jgi:glycosyltransferase involved in cell wall biosynthesis